MNREYDFDELIDRHLRGELNDAQREALARWLDSDREHGRHFVENAQWETRITEVLRASGDADTADALSGFEKMAPAITGARPELVLGGNEGANVDRPRLVDQIRLARLLLTVAFVLIAALAASLYRQQSSDPPIAKITGLSGSLLWTGDGGLVRVDLREGTELTGGTLEGTTPNSWVELEFQDRTTVTISGNSRLTFAEQTQKELYLAGGKASASVKPQPAGKPMLIQTRAANLEVLGTQLNIESDLTSTTLNVSEGKVRMTRLIDGSSVDVPARHRVTASADAPFIPERVPVAVDRWTSSLTRGPQGTLGTWNPGSAHQEASLRAVPFVATTADETTFTIYSVGLGVSQGDSAPVIIRSDSLVRIRGRLDLRCDVIFGVTVNHLDGEFAGKFQAIESMESLGADNRFDVVLPLSEFRLDPSLAAKSDDLPADPLGSVVEAFWCHTLNEPAGLEIYDVTIHAKDAEDDPGKSIR